MNVIRSLKSSIRIRFNTLQKKSAINISKNNEGNVNNNDCNVITLDKTNNGKKKKNLINENNINNNTSVLNKNNNNNVSVRPTVIGINESLENFSTHNYNLYDSLSECETSDTATNNNVDKHELADVSNINVIDAINSSTNRNNINKKFTINTNTFALNSPFNNDKSINVLKEKITLNKNMSDNGIIIIILLTVIILKKKL